eukprot:scaffold3691_cov394-Prasinococcus_capsulatus_cf.AAC.14
MPSRRLRPWAERGGASRRDAGPQRRPATPAAHPTAAVASFGACASTPAGMIIPFRLGTDGPSSAPSGLRLRSIHPSVHPSIRDGARCAVEAAPPAPAGLGLIYCPLGKNTRTRSAGGPHALSVPGTLRPIMGSTL